MLISHRYYLTKANVNNKHKASPLKRMTVETTPLKPYKEQDEFEFDILEVFQKDYGVNLPFEQVRAVGEGITILCNLSLAKEGIVTLTK